MTTGGGEQTSRSAHPGQQLAELPTGEADLTVSTRQLDRFAYAHDASHYLLTPSAVVPPTAGSL